MPTANELVKKEPKTYRGKSTREGGGGKFAEIADKAAKEYGSKEAGERVAAAVGRRELGSKKMGELSAAGRARAARKRKRNE